VAWRNVVSQPQRTTLVDDAGTEHVVEWWGGRDGYAVADPDLRVLSATPDEVLLEVGGVTARFEISHTRGHKSRTASGVPGFVYVEGGLTSARLREQPRFTDPADAVASGSLLAPMPGSVVRVAVEDGATVAAGDPVLVLEAMKMQHTISAPSDGVVTDLVAVGTQVAAGDVLAVVSSVVEPVETTSTQGEP
jgi:propionyl-CoA carboxylase alpha chain